MMPMRCNAGAMVAMVIMAAMADGFGGAGDLFPPICVFCICCHAIEVRLF